MNCEGNFNDEKYGKVRYLTILRRFNWMLLLKKKLSDRNLRKIDEKHKNDEKSFLKTRRKKLFD